MRSKTPTSHPSVPKKKEELREVEGFGRVDITDHPGVHVSKASIQASSATASTEIPVQNAIEAVRKGKPIPLTATPEEGSLPETFSELIFQRLVTQKQREEGEKGVVTLLEILRKQHPEESAA